MSRSSAAKNTAKTPWRIEATPNGIIDFAEAPSLHTPMDNVVGGPPAYLESHGIRYVPEAAPAGLSSDASAHGLEAETVHHYTRQDLDARVDTRVSQFMRESSHGLGAPMRPLDESAGAATAGRLRGLKQRVEAGLNAPLPAAGRSGRKPGYDH
jgi:hypothetical protein